MTTQEFVEKYNIGITFEEMYVLQHKANRMKYFTFKDKYLKNNTKSYLDGLKYMFSTYIANRIHPEKIEIGSTANLNFVQFVRDYEAAKKDEFEKSNSNRKRKPYEGVEKQALTMIEAQMKYFNTSVSKIWANAIKKGAHLEGFRSIVTDAENQALARNNADESARRKYSPAEKRTNALLCVTYKALHTVINERTWGWRLNPFNWKRWYQENALMDDLTKRLEVLEITTDINPVSNRKTDGLLYAQCKDDVIDEVEIRNFKRYSELGKKAREEIDKINAQEQDLDAFLDADELDNELNLDAPDNENDIFNDLNQSVIMNGDPAELDGDGEILNALINEEIEAEKREQNLNEQENLKQQAIKDAKKREKESLKLDKNLGENVNDKNVSPKIESKDAPVVSNQLNK